MVRLCQASLWRTRTYSALRRPLHPPHAAISNYRLTAFDGERVSFRWRDYAHGSKQRVMTFDAVSFLCRFFLHVPPWLRTHPPLRSALQPLPQTTAALVRTRPAAQGREPLIPLLPCSRLRTVVLPPPGEKAMRVVQRFTAAQLYFAGFDTS